MRAVLGGDVACRVAIEKDAAPQLKRTALRLIAQLALFRRRVQPSENFHYICTQ